MLLTSRIFKEDDNWIADFPFLESATFCDESEDIVDYVIDYFQSQGIETEAWRENDDTVIIAPHDPHKIIALILKHLRGKRTLAEVTTGTELARTTLHQYERGMRDPSFATLTKLLAVNGYDFEVTIRRRS